MSTSFETRRRLLRMAAGGLVLALPGARLALAAPPASAARSADRLVVVLLRGALDGLAAVPPTPALLTALLLFSAVHFGLNSVLTAAHHAIKKRTGLYALWRANYSWTCLTYAASASAAGLIYLAVIQYGVSSLLAAGPLVAVIFATCHFYFKQSDERTKATERISRLHLATVEALATAIDANGSPFSLGSSSTSRISSVDSSWSRSAR